jgi:LMBR1 domain-containing protein 1
VVKGNFALGVRFLFWKMYPMEVGNTMMNAFLFNTFFILLCAVPCVQFCIDAFPVYAAYTQANVMFGNQIQYLTFFSYFYTNNVFVIATLIISGLTIIVMLAFPKNKAASVEAQLDALAKSTNTSLHDYAEP